MATLLGVVLANARLLDGALALMRQNHGDSRLFLMDDGVLAADDPRIDTLILDGNDVILCAMDAEARGVGEREGGPQAGSQYDHAVLVRDAARLVTFSRVGRDPSDSTVALTVPRQVLVEIAAPDALASSALRAAMAFGALGLEVTVLAERGLGAVTATAERARVALGRRVCDRRPETRFDVIELW